MARLIIFNGFFRMLNISFKSPHFPSNALNKETIMFYFCSSDNPFYERSCDNETIRMQNNMNTNISVHDMLL